MSAINRKSKKTSNNNSLFILVGVISAVSLLLFAYLMWYVAPEENIERVKVIAITESGCVAETFDGFAVDIGECNAQPGDYILALVDQKTKERAALMNPTR